MENQKQKSNINQPVVNGSNRLADYYAEMYKQNKKQIGETDQEYRNRIAYYLRDNKNKILEGQSVLDNEFVKRNDVDVCGRYYR